MRFAVAATTIFFYSFTLSYAQDQGVDYAPSGYESQVMTVYPDNSSISMPGADSNDLEYTNPSGGPGFIFDHQGTDVQGSSGNLDNTTIIYSDD